VVFVDIDDNYCMDIADLAAKITPNSKAIIPVHLYGRAARMDAIMELAAKHNLRVIEDACQSHGAVFQGKKTGNLGDVGCFSFYETKNMTCGEGGMITTSDEALYTQICLRREHGSPRGGSTWYDYQKLGYNYNMTELQGAIGLVQLGKLDSMNDARIQNAALYDTHLADSGLLLPPPTDGINVYHNYPVLLPAELRDKRDFFVEAMRAEGVAIDVAYPCTLYQTELFKKAGIDGHCPRAEDISSRIVTLFTDKSIDEAAISSTAQAVKKVLAYLKKSHASAQ
jgi:dTDP-4-amino-4,6-dideoxygalactose transaminase